MAHSRGSKQRIRHAKKAVKAMQLRLKGLRYAEIGRQLGMSEQHAWRLVMKELDLLNTQRAEAAERVQRLEVERLDEMLSAIWSKAKKGDFAAIDRILAIMQRRAKLLGLDLADQDRGEGGGATITLNVQEVIVNGNPRGNGQHGEIAADGVAAIEEDTAPPGTRRLPAK